MENKMKKFELRNLIKEILLKENTKLDLVNRIIKLDPDYNDILMRKTQWGVEWEYWTINDLKDLLKDLNNDKKKNVKEDADYNAQKPIKIFIDSYPWYIKKIDSTHIEMSNTDKKMWGTHASHIGQHRGEPYYDDLDKWLHGGKSLDGKKYYSNSNENINEKAVSKAQQQAAGIAHAAQKGDISKSKLKGASKQMAKMKPKDLKDFAKTKHTGLPDKVKKEEKLREYVRKIILETLKEAGENPSIQYHKAIDADKIVFYLFYPNGNSPVFRAHNGKLYFWDQNTKGEHKRIYANDIKDAKKKFADNTSYPSNKISFRKEVR